LHWAIVFFWAVFRNWVLPIVFFRHFFKLGEFSHIGRLFSFGSFSKLGEFLPMYWAIVFFGQFFEIGRIFAYWAIVFFRQFFKIGRFFSPIGRLFSLVSFSKITVVAQFFLGKNYVLILRKMGCATFWAIFYKLIWSPCLQQ
jgi:hypothetical protein